MQITFFNNYKFSSHHSEIIQIGKLKAISLVESDRDIFLESFTDAERSVLVKATNAWIRSKTNAIELSHLKLKEHLCNRSARHVSRAKLTVALSRDEQFKKYMYYHYLIHLHLTEEVPFASYKASAGFYNRYLTSHRWASIRAQIMEQQSFTCETWRCYSPIAVVHHNNYVRLGKEQLEDLAGLCDHCHYCVHYAQSDENSASLSQLEFEFLIAI